MLRAFPDATYLAPNDGCVLPATWLDWTPKVAIIPPAAGLLGLAQAIHKVGNRDRVVVVDDFSVMVRARFRELKKMSNTVWHATDQLALEVLDHVLPAAKNASAHVFMTAHEQAPREIKKENQATVRYIKGCPMLAGWQLPDEFPGLVDFIARVVDTRETSGWPYAYQTGPDPEYVTGDRLSIAPPQFPMNLRELMLAAGYDLPRPKVLDWMDPVIEKLSDVLVAAEENDDDKEEVLNKVLPKLLDKTKNERHIRWVIADSFDRAVLKQHQKTLLSKFITDLGAKSL
jgi:hypothetical protein